MRFWSVIFAFSIHLSVAAQDTLTVMTYNLLKFPGATPERVDSMRKVFHYVLPDILIVNELQSEAGSELILNEALNKYEIDDYQAVNYVDGFGMDNMLYYNGTKLGFVDQDEVITSLRDINEYILYYKSPGLDENSDTIYLNIYVAHLKAGGADFEERADQCTTLKYHMNSRGSMENVIVGGDFNFYSGHESGCLILRETGDIHLNDPVDQIGNWSSNSSYAQYHSQSSRTSGFDEGIGGGLDDRFDILFVSNDVLDNTNGLTYLSGSYETLGQDGMRYNQSVISPGPTTVPDSVASALYYSSDHLPVMMKLVTDYTAGISPDIKSCQPVYDLWNQRINFGCVMFGELSLYNTQGQLVRKNIVNGQTGMNVSYKDLEGILIWKLRSENDVVSGRVFISP